MFSKDAVISRTRKENDLYEFNYDMNIDGILIAQGYGQLCSHIDIVNRYDVGLFIELGMYMGGTLPYLIPRLMLDDSFTYMGFEILPGAVHPKVMQFASSHPRCHVLIEDMFLLKNVKHIARSIRSSSRPVYVFCDGGNKPKELFTFSRFLRIGDIISVHDYSDSQTGEIKDIDLNKLGSEFDALDEDWRKHILWLPTFMRIK